MSLEDERAAYGVDHARAGAYLLGVWGLPDEIVEAVAFHHEPGRYNADRFGITAAVHVALAMNDRHREGGRFPLDESLIASLGKTDRIATWAAIVEKHEYEKANR